MRERGAYHCGLVALRLATLAARVTATAIRPANRRWPGMKRQKTIRGSPQRLESLTAVPSAVPRSPPDAAVAATANFATYEREDHETCCGLVRGQSE